MGLPDLSRIVTAPALSGLLGQQEPWWLWTADASRLLLTNASGAVAMGATGATMAMERSYSSSHAFAGQIVRLAAHLPEAGETRMERLRLFGRAAAAMLLVQARRLTLAGEETILVQAPANGQGQPLTQAAAFVEGLPVPGLLFSRDGEPLAASRTAKGLAGVSLQRLLGDVTETVLAELFSQGTARITLITGDLSLSLLAQGEAMIGAYAFSSSGNDNTTSGNGLRLVSTPETATVAETPAPVAETSAPAPVTETPAPRRFEAFRPVSRLVWRTDGQDVFLDDPQGLAALVGDERATITGRAFGDLASAWQLDPNGDARAAFATRAVWNGVKVFWPRAQGDGRIALTLSAVPLLDNGRFGGYRGFAVTTGEVIPDAVPAEPIALDTSLAEAPASEPVVETETIAPPQPEPAAPEAPAMSEAPSETPVAPEAPAAEAPAEAPVEAGRPQFTLVQTPENVVPLRTAPPGEPRRNALTPVERMAFREIARTLQGRIGETDATDEAPATERATPEAPEAPSAATAPVDTAPLAPTSTEAVAAPADEATAATHDETVAVPPEEDTPFASAPDMAESDPFDAPLLPANSGDESVAAPSDEAPAAAAEASAPEAPDAPFDSLDLIERLPVGLVIHRGNAVLYANRTLLDWTGYVDALALEQAGGLARLFAASGEGDTTSLTDAKGETFEVNTRLSRVSYAGEPALLFTLRRVEPVNMLPLSSEDDLFSAADHALAETRARLDEVESVLDTATDGIAVLDHSGAVESLNHSAEALFGYESAEIKGRSFTMLFAPDSQRVAQDYLDGLTSNGVASILNDGRETVGRVKQGGLIPLYITLGRIGSGEKTKFAAVFRDMTQWKKAEQELLEARRAAEKASSHKSDFLAKVSHEIRTPLNAIIGFSEVMMEERFGPIANERYRDYLRDIHLSGSHVLSLINDLLDLSKIEAGKLDLTFTSVDLNTIVQQCTALIQPQATRERVVIRSSLHPRLPHVVADDRSVRQIVLNLLSNSVKFTPPSGQVIISTTLSAQGEAVIRVRDTGAGMNEQEIRAALEPFRQVASAPQSSTVAGTGLGLPLTKALVEANRASFALSSQPGHGTLVEVTFPPTRVLAE